MADAIKISQEEFIKIALGNYRNIKAYEKFYDKDNTKVIIFRNALIEDISLNQQSLHTIRFYNCKIDSLHINYESKVNGLYFHDNCTIGNIFVANKASIGTIFFACTHVQHISIGHANVTGLRVTANTIMGPVVFMHASCKTINFEDSTVNHLGQLESNVDSVYIKHTIIGEINVKSSAIKNTAVDHSHICKIALDYPIAPSKILKVTNSRVEIFEISVDIEYDLIVNESLVYDFKVNPYKLVNKLNLNISDCQINNLDFDAFNNRAKMVLSNIEAISQIELFKTSENGKPIFKNGAFEFHQTKRLSQIWIINSDLGDCQMINCAWHTFDEFIFQNSKLLDTFAAGTTLPSNHKIKTLGLEDDIVHELEQKRLVFNQFKKIYEKQGDMIRATQYLAEELEIYREQLRYLKATTKKERLNKFGEQTNLFLNRVSSYHGNNL